MTTTQQLIQSFNALKPEAQERIATELGFKVSEMRPFENVEYLMRPDVKAAIAEKLFNQLTAQ